MSLRTTETRHYGVSFSSCKPASCLIALSRWYLHQFLTVDCFVDVWFLHLRGVSINISWRSINFDICDAVRNKEALQQMTSALGGSKRKLMAIISGGCLCVGKRKEGGTHLWWQPPAVIVKWLTPWRSPPPPSETGHISSNTEIPRLYCNAKA
jgi:hypothetical protein